MICHQLNLIILFWELFNFSGVLSEKTCALDVLFSCSDEETCEEVRNSSFVGICKCRKNYKVTPDGFCLQQVDTDHTSLPTAEGVYSRESSVSAIAGGLLTAVLLVVLAALLVFAAKKYRWVHRVREKAQRFRERHYDTVLVSQEDDPPLAMKMLVALAFCVFMTFSMLVYVMKPTAKCEEEPCFEASKAPRSQYFYYNFTESSRRTPNSSSPEARRTSRDVGTLGPGSATAEERERTSPRTDLSRAEVYEDRRRNLQRFCQKYFNADEIRKIRKIKLNHILIDEKHKVLYCYVPKVACTNWKRIFLVLTEKAETVAQVINLPSSEVHAKNLFKSLQNYTIPEVQKIVEEYTKFIFVRHPFERLLSAYRNKLEQHYNSSKYFQARFGKFIIKNFRKNPSNGSLERGDDVTFAEFVNYLISSDPRSYNEHWQRVTDLCHPCLVNYNFVGKYESLIEDSNYLLRYLGLNVSFPILAKPSTTATSLKNYYNTLGKSVIYKLYSIYQMDFRLFGYDLFNTSDWSNNS